MERSASNRPSLTHWWNWQSSSSTPPRSDFLFALASSHVAHVPFLLKENPIVEAKLAVGHAGKIGAHHHLTSHLGPKIISLRRAKQVDRLHDVDEKLVPPILEIGSAP